MTCIDSLPQYDDESFALQLQLEDIEAQRQSQTGKWAENNPPDFALAFHDFENELQKALLLVEDLKFAHSIAKAVVSDAVAIEESRAEEAQSLEDRGFARSLNEDENLPIQEAIDLPEISRFGSDLGDWDFVLRATEASTFSTVVCGDAFHPHATVRLACNDVYCKPCLKFFFMRVTKDESLFPPKCQRQAIDISTIETDFSVEELKTYRDAEQEFTSTNRVYCADPECAKFIIVTQRAMDRASCENCGTSTCMHCKAPAHDGWCPVDERKETLLKFADKQGWKACFGCAVDVVRNSATDAA
ncbi:uncharacterized protein RAG0_01735 [Rhynchosporium agropyri]|uniref:IBR domain-containing protein n=1 Tax=Rhynchosporium agropyri TaxID=914238 RepID=A0A1E1JYW0_9HELO|nr:uncharacterized protein RAG0_01735 [Rhynchosporium agropyri]